MSDGYMDEYEAIDTLKESLMKMKNEVMETGSGISFNHAMVLLGHFDTAIDTFTDKMLQRDKLIKDLNREIDALGSRSKLKVVD